VGLSRHFDRLLQRLILPEPDNPRLIASVAGFVATRDVIEAAPAHALESKVERAYRRSTAFEKRRDLLEAWADSCGNAKSSVASVAPKGLVA
jgi:hypothetical protein